MSEPKKLFILAGEPSGDRIGADLVRRLRQHGQFALSGVGGPELELVGLRSLYAMNDLSVMGLSDVLKRLPLLLWRIEQTARAVLSAAPDVVVLVDAQEFSVRLARRLRRAGFVAPILLYVAPSVWARAPERAKKLRPLFDEILAVFPFEPGVMVRLEGPPTHYVGHPALAEAQQWPAQRDGQRVALLPGSRPGELRRHLPLLKAVVAALAQRADVRGFFLPTLAPLAVQLEAEVSTWAAPVSIVADRGERLALYGETRLAVATAGTATLELALAGVPMVVTYVMERAQARKFIELGRPRVGLPNIILGEDVTPEIIVDSSETAALLRPVEQLLDNQLSRSAQTEAFGRLRTLMELGLPDAPREDPADRVLAHLRQD